MADWSRLNSKAKTSTPSSPLCGRRLDKRKARHLRRAFLLVCYSSRLLGDDVYVQIGGHFAMQAHGHFVLTRVLDRIFQLDLAAVDCVVLAFKGVRDVFGSH